jgi:hypothetical protein
MKKEGIECRLCWYWHKQSENAGEWRANPPVSIPNVVGPIPNWGCWLQTRSEDWCGNFRPEKSSRTESVANK